MRILHCTDFHGNKAWFDWLAERAGDYDLTCLTGDHLDLLDLNRINAQLSMVSAELGRVCAPLALSSGNNDSFGGPPAPANLQHAAWLTELRRTDVWIDGDGFEVGGMRFRCIGWNAPLPSADADETWLYHAPPARSPVAVDSCAGDVGDEILGELCRAGSGPAMVLSGHQHDPRQWACRVGRTWCLNPGNNRHASVPNHIIIDTLTRTAVLRANDRDHPTVSIS